MKSTHHVVLVVPLVLMLGAVSPAAALEDVATTSKIAQVVPVVFSNQGERANFATPSNATKSQDVGLVYNRPEVGISVSVENIRSIRMETYRGLQHQVLTSRNDIEYVSVLKNDGSVQIVGVIPSRDSDEKLQFNFELPAGAKTRLLPSGGVMILDVNGAMIGGISPPWALDSSGKEVRTRFELAKGKLIQHVIHSSENFTYPIIADPWIGIDLYQDPYVTRHKEGYRINVKPTLWGLTTVSSPTWFAHRAEVLTKLGKDSTLWSGTIQEQFYCHIFGSPAGYPEYNMESWSPLVPWFQSLFLHRCNP